MTTWPPGEALWASVVSTLESDLLPALSGPAHAVALQLSGLARYALQRGDDPSPSRAAELAPLVGAPPGSGWPDVAAAAGDILAGRARPEAAAPLRDRLLAFVDEDLSRTEPLLETFARHGSSEVGEGATSPAEREALGRWFSERLGAGASPVTVRLISGGHSRRMLDVTTGDGQRFVVRVEQGGVFGTEGGSEAVVMEALGGAGLPVAPVRWIEGSAKVLGHPFFVMERVEGGHDADEAAMEVFVRALDDLHRRPVDGLAGAFPVVPSGPEDGVRAAIDHWTRVYRDASPVRVPLLDGAAAWLHAHLRPTGPLCVVHGDPGPGNFIHRDGRVVAFTDWEFAHLGDAAEDWVYLAAMRGVRMMDTEQWKQWLADRVGVSFDEATWRAWTVFNLFKGACANITALRVFVDGASRGPNLLAVGTALHLRMVRRLTDLVAEG